MLHGRRIESFSSDQLVRTLLPSKYKLGLMNPRRVHSSMKAGFASYDSVALDWAILARTANCAPTEVERFLEAAFASEQVLVEVNRFTGRPFSLPEAAEFPAPQVGRETVHFADRGFTSFAVIASHGVAASWAKGTVAKREVLHDVQLKVGADGLYGPALRLQRQVPVA